MISALIHALIVESNQWLIPIYTHLYSTLNNTIKNIGIKDVVALVGSFGLTLGIPRKRAWGILILSTISTWACLIDFY